MIQLSWTSYFTIVALLTGLYYAAVLFLFYRKEITELILRPRTGELKPKPAESKDQDADFERLEEFIKDIDSYLVKAGKQISKEELLMQLRNRLTSFDGLQHPAYRVAIYNHIISKADELCGMKINAADLEKG